MTTDTEGNPNPHAPRYPSDLPPRRDGTSPAAASPRKRLAMARAILSALDVAGALALLLAVRSFARVALAAGIGYVRKVGAPVKVSADGLPCGWSGVGGADYVGALCDGRALAVEAKSCVGRLQRDDLAPHQRNDLARVEAMGGLALVLVELRAEGGALLGRWCVPWSELETRWRVSRRAKPGRSGSQRAEDYVESRSAGAAELAGLEVDPGCYLRPWAQRPGTPAPPRPVGCENSHSHTQTDPLAPTRLAPGQRPAGDGDG